MVRASPLKGNLAPPTPEMIAAGVDQSETGAVRTLGAMAIQEACERVLAKAEEDAADWPGTRIRVIHYGLYIYVMWCKGWEGNAGHPSHFYREIGKPVHAVVQPYDREGVLMAMCGAMQAALDGAS